jgi:hypothetical protein
MENSNTNTILIVILILIVVGFGAYWYNHVNAAPKDTSGGSLQINLTGNGDTKSAQ